MRSTDLVARLRLDSKPFDRTLKQSQADLQGFSRVAGALPGRNLFSGLAADASALLPTLSSVPLGIAAVGAAMAGAGLAARRAGVEFEASLAKIATLGPNAERSLGETRQAIMDTYSSVPITGPINDLAEANYLLQSSGRSAEEALQDLRIAAEASVAGYTSVTTAVDGITTVTNAWKESQISSAQASDVLFSAVNVGKATFEEIAQSIGLVAPLAASAGVRFEEVAAAVAVLSNQGLRTSSIFEGMRSAILNIQRPTEAFKREYSDLAREFGASRLARDGVVKFLQDFNRESGGSRKALNALFSDATGLLTVLGLLKNNGDDAAAALKQMDTAAGSTSIALSKATATAAAQEQLIRNQLTGAWTDFGDLLRRSTIPILEGVARALNSAKGGANFLKSDIGILQRTLGPRQLSDFEQLQRRGAVASILKQYEANKDNAPDFFRSLTDEELRFVRQQVRLAQSGPQTGGRFPGSFDAFDSAATLERNRRAEAARQGEVDKRAAEATAATAAETRAAEEERDRERSSQQDRDKVTGRALEKQAEDAKRTREQIVRSAAELTKELEAKTIEALQGTAGALQRALDETLQAGAKKLKSGVLSPEEAEPLRAQLELFKQVQLELISAEKQAALTKQALDSALSQEEIPALRTIGNRERELVVILKGTKSLEARKKLEADLAALAAARGELTGGVFNTKGSDDISSTTKEMGDLAQSIATVADQLELLPRRAVDALRGIGALAEQGTKLSDAFKVGSGAKGFDKFSAAIGVAAGVASLAAGLFGESPEDKQRRAELRANTEAIRTLSKNVGDLSASTISGSALGRIRSGLGNVNSFFADYPTTQRTLRDVPGAIASRTGTTVAEVQSLAQTLGITLSNSMESLVAFAALVQQSDLNAYMDTFAGSFQRFEDLLRIDGVTDSFEIFRRRVAVFTDPKTGFPALASALNGVDLTTVEGRDEASRRARGIYDDLAAGRLTPEQRGELSIPEARSTLVDFISSIIEQNSGAPGGTGGFNETRSITEVTGSRLAGLFSSANSFLERIASDVATLRAAIVPGAPIVLTAPTLPRTGSTGSSSHIAFHGDIIITVSLTRDLLGADAGQTLDRANLFGKGIADSMMQEIDRKLLQRQQREKLYHGDVRLST